MAKNTHCPQVLRARHLLTSVLLAMAPKVWMHKPDIPGLLVVRIVEKHLLSTDASREAPVDKCARRQCVYTCVPDLDVGQKEKPLTEFLPENVH